MTLPDARLKASRTSTVAQRRRALLTLTYNQGGYQK